MHNNNRLTFRQMLNPASWFMLCCLLLLGSMAQAQDGYTKTIKIVAGQTKLIYYKNVNRVSIGDPDVANAISTEEDEVLVTGLKPGVTDIRFWAGGGLAEARYLLRVVDDTHVRVLQDVRGILSVIEGVEAREENDIVFIEGRILRPQDAAVIDALRENLAKEVKQGVVIFNVGGLTVDLKQMIRLDVKVVELRRQDLERLGIRWAQAIDGPFYTGVTDGFGFDIQNPEIDVLGDIASVNGSGLDIATRLTSTIDILKTSGVARVLAEPKLTTTSGSKAEFLAGGEVPIPIIDDDGKVDVTFKKVGIILDIEPIADPEGFIAATVNVEVSTIDPSVEVRDIPGFLVRRTKSDFNVQQGQTMVLSGMLNAEDGKTIDKVPGLGDIPVLGELFKSRDFQRRTTELVVLVTPYLVEPEGQRNAEMVERAHFISSDEAESFEMQLMD